MSIPHNSISRDLQQEDARFFACLSVLVFGFLAHWLYQNLNSILIDGEFVPTDFHYIWLVSDLLPDKAPDFAYDPPRYTREVVTRFGPHDIVTIWPYPPHSWLVIWPLAFLPLQPAFVIWEILGLCVLGWVVYRTFGASSWAVFFVLSSPAVAANLRFGQSGSLTTALLVAGLGFIERRPHLAGFFIGLLTIKPTLGVLLPLALLAGGHGRVFMSAALTTLCLILASVAIFGIDPWIAYLTVAIDHALELQYAKEGSISYFIPTVTRAARTIGFDIATAHTVQLLVSLVCVVLIAWVWRVYPNVRLCSALLMACVILVPPYALAYDMPMTAVAALILLQEIGNDGGRPGERILVVLVWMLPALLILFNLVGIPIAPILLLLLAMALLRRCLQSPKVKPNELIWH